MLLSLNYTFLSELSKRAYSVYYCESVQQQLNCAPPGTMDPLLRCPCIIGTKPKSEVFPRIELNLPSSVACLS